MAPPFYMNTVEIKFRRVLTRDLHPTPTDDWDDDFREPVNKKRFEGPFTFQAQVNTGRIRQFDQRIPSSIGDATDTSMHLVFSNTDYPSTLPLIKKGDLVVEIGGRVVDLLVDQVRPESPLRSFGSSSLISYVELIENENQR